VGHRNEGNSSGSSPSPIEGNLDGNLNAPKNVSGNRRPTLRTEMLSLYQVQKALEKIDV
jgi:hypothetical protein